MLKFQNYQHYKLPITMNPLEYGKLIIKIDNLFILQVNRTNIVLITQSDEFNIIKLYKEGDLIFEYKDHKTTDNTFVRSLYNKNFTFKNNKLSLITYNKSINNT
jgi:tRNA(His) 5'-end guanylyltransferase